MCVWVCVCEYSVFQSCPTLWPHGLEPTRLSLSLEFSRQGFWSGLPFPSYRASFRPRDQTCISCVSCIDRKILYHYHHLQSPLYNIGPLNSFPAAAAAAKSLQSCPTLCDPIDGSPPGSTVPGILQARTLEWVATLFLHTVKPHVWATLAWCLTNNALIELPWTAVPLSLIKDYFKE